MGKKSSRKSSAATIAAFAALGLSVGVNVNNVFIENAYAAGEEEEEDIQLVTPGQVEKLSENVTLNYAEIEKTNPELAKKLSTLPPDVQQRLLKEIQVQDLDSKQMKLGDIQGESTQLKLGDIDGESTQVKIGDITGESKQIKFEGEATQIKFDGVDGEVAAKPKYQQYSDQLKQIQQEYIKKNNR